MSRYTDFVSRKRREYGLKFSEVSLAKQFVRYYNSGERVKVLYSGEEITGTVSTTTGWRPCFLLMRRSNAIGSMYTLGDGDRVIAVQRNGRYVPVPED